MTANVFLSHDSRDKQLAKIIADTLSRITLNGLRVWYSSDSSSSGGIQAGSVWSNEIRSQLECSKAIIALLTPRSIERPWIYFESGFGAASKECDVVPVCIGVDSLSDIPFPLAMYQCYQLVDYDSLRDFSARILNKHSIPFDEGLCKHVLQQSVTALTDAMPPLDAEQDVELSTQEILAQTVDRIDRRFTELHKRIDEFAHSSSPVQRVREYSVPFNLKFDGETKTNYLTIDKTLTVQDVLDNVYFMIDKHVKRFSYMQTWLMSERKSLRKLVIREIGDLVPASCIFREASIWDVFPLDKPYSHSDSDDISRWYRKERARVRPYNPMDRSGGSAPS